MKIPGFGATKSSTQPLDFSPLRRLLVKPRDNESQLAVQVVDRIPGARNFAGALESVLGKATVSKLMLLRADPPHAAISSFSDHVSLQSDDPRDGEFLHRLCDCVEDALDPTAVEARHFILPDHPTDVEHGWSANYLVAKLGDGSFALVGVAAAEP
jgi:hypothetical protein